MSTVTAPPQPAALGVADTSIRGGTPANPALSGKSGDHGSGGETRIAIPGVSWEFYEHFVDGIPENSHVRTAFDGRDLEIMTKSSPHEDFRNRLHKLVEIVTDELEIPCKALGETTWKRPEIARGIEADQSYYFSAQKMEQAGAALARRSRDIADYPNPDMVIEVDISPSLVDRPGIYAAMGVTELWRFDGETLVIERLSPEGTDLPAGSSGFVPIPAVDAARWILDDEQANDTAWRRRLRSWVREVLIPSIENRPDEPEAGTTQGTESA